MFVVHGGNLGYNFFWKPAFWGLRYMPLIIGLLFNNMYLDCLVIKSNISTRSSFKFTRRTHEDAFLNVIGLSQLRRLHRWKCKGGSSTTYSWCRNRGTWCWVEAFVIGVAARRDWVCSVDIIMVTVNRKGSLWWIVLWVTHCCVSVFKQMGITLLAKHAPG